MRRPSVDSIGASPRRIGLLGLRCPKCDWVRARGLRRDGRRGLRPTEHACVDLRPPGGTRSDSVTDADDLRASDRAVCGHPANAPHIKHERKIITSRRLLIGPRKDGSAPAGTMG